MMTPLPRRNLLALVVCSLLLASPLAGCAGEGEDAPEAAVKGGAATPKEWFLGMVQALESGDREAWRDLLVGDDEALDFQLATFDYLSSGLRLKKAVIEAHGEDGWKELADDDHARLSFEMIADARGVERMTFEIRGDQAVGKTAEGSQAQLVRRGGRWFVDARAGMGPIPDVPAETARLAAQASIFSRYAELASKPKVTPEDMDRALEIEILNIGTSEDGVPDRGEGIPAAQRYHRMPGKNGG